MNPAVVLLVEGKGHRSLSSKDKIIILCFTLVCPNCGPVRVNPYPSTESMSCCPEEKIRRGVVTE